LPHPILIRLPLLATRAISAGIAHSVSGPGGVASRISVPPVDVHIPVDVDVD